MPILGPDQVAMRRMAARQIQQDEQEARNRALLAEIAQYSTIEEVARALAGGIRRAYYVAAPHLNATIHCALELFDLDAGQIAALSGYDESERLCDTVAQRIEKEVRVQENDQTSFRMRVNFWNDTEPPHLAVTLWDYKKPDPRAMDNNN